ncbi:kinetochore complex Sim4 subunit Fta1-domain-containing protein [Xylaria grammica]|nr:kinetochore complex Sim4 subunit Fta1-domain-containing protein [Xylaria grammica]
MPPKKRGRPTTSQAPQPEPESEPAGPGDNASNQTDQEQNSDRGSDQDLSQTDAEAKSVRFFNTTFSTFRVSPLYIGKDILTQARLETLSQRLRDTLVGDVVRGVQVGLEGDGTLGRLGTLDRVEWRECGLETLFPTLVDGEERIGDEARQRRRGAQGRKGKGKARETQEEKKRHLLCLELEYEKATFSALMLPSLDERNTRQSADEGEDESPQLRKAPPWIQNHKEDEDATDAFAHFPLLLTRMPAPLKSVLVDFLSSTFDCRISPLHLGTRTLIHSLERWIKESGVDDGRKALNKDVALTLGFHLEPTTDAAALTGSAPDDQKQQSSYHGPSKPAPLGLKTIDVVVPAEESRRFLRVGKRIPTDSPTHADNSSARPGSRKRPADTAGQEEERLRRRRLGGGKDEEGWTWRKSAQQDQDQNADNDWLETFAQPFTNAVSQYLSHHLALDMTHPGVRVLRVVCDAFALSETRMKVFAPPRGGAGADTGAAAVDTFLRDLIRRAQGREWSAGARRLANLRVIA